MRRALAGGFELDDDLARLDVDAVHAFISEQSYWGRGRPRDLQDLAIRGSLRVVGLYKGSEQIGFARAVGDGDYRTRFIDPLIDDLRLTLVARSRYRAAVAAQ